MKGNYKDMKDIELNISEKLSFLKDKYNLDENNFNKLRGHVILRDALTGEIIEEKDNLITLRARSFVLELLFGLNAPEGYINNKDRTVCLFNIGSGGADLQASPLEAISPKFSDTGMYSEIPFVIVSDLKETLPEYQANPSIIEELNEEQKKTYYLPKEQPDGSVRYYAKVFEKDSERLKLDKNNGVVYWHGTCRITPQEARGFVLNELGLILAHYDEERNAYTDAEQFSHITFSSIALTSLNNGILIEYLVYA